MKQVTNFSLVIGLIAFPLVLGGCVFKKDFVRYKKVVQKQTEAVQIQQVKTGKKQTNRIQWLERRLRQHKKLQRLQHKKNQAKMTNGFRYVFQYIFRTNINQTRISNYNFRRLTRSFNYMRETTFRLAESVYGDGVESFIGKCYYRTGNNNLALFYFEKSVFTLERRIKRRKAKCGKKSCRLYLADSLYGRALIYSMQMKTKKAMKDLHRLDELKLLKKFKKFWENSRFEKLHGLPAWLKLVKKYKK